MIIKTVTFRHVARISPRGRWGFDLRRPAWPHQTKLKNARIWPDFLLLGFFRDPHLSAKHLQRANIRVRFRSEAAYPVTKSVQISHTPSSDL